MNQDRETKLPSRPEDSGRMKSFRLRILVISIAALITSVYLAVHHIKVNTNLEAGPTFCTVSASFDCDAVARSSYSELFGVPVASLGIGFYLIFSWLAFLMVRGKRDAHKLDNIALVLGVLAFVPSMVFLYISMFELQTICLFCSFLYLCSLALLSLTWLLNRTYGVDQAVLTGLKGFFSWTKGLSPRDFFTDLAILAVAAGSTFQLPTFLHNSFYAEDVSKKLSSPIEKEQSSLLYQKWLNSPLQSFEFNKDGEINNRDFFIGSAQPVITVVEFSDMECPHCRRAAPKLKKIISDYQEHVALYFRSYPLDSACNSKIKNQMHKYACQGARAIRCAGEVSDEMFWTVHDELYRYLDFDHQAIASLPELFLDSEEKTKFKVCLESNYPVGVKRDIAEGNRVKLRSTPSIFIQGKLLPEFNEKLIREIFQSLLSPTTEID